MDYIAALWYGIIQGLTEFLPVSSSGHLAILPHFLKIEDPGVLFDLSMHIGTALSIIVYFRAEVKELIWESISLIKMRREHGPERSYAINMIVATGSTFVLALIIKSAAESFGRQPQLIAFNLFLFGILMFIADYFCQQSEDGQMNKINIKASVAIGLFQALALFPGVSRSGSTLTISRFLRLSRKEAARFSFLLSLPIIFAGFILKLPDFFKEGLKFDVMACFFGGGISFIVGIITIHFFLKVIKQIGLGVFAFYRLILAGMIYAYII
jgi:undecaprenyl-diphosphatase